MNKSELLSMLNKHFGKETVKYIDDGKVIAMRNEQNKLIRMIPGNANYNEIMTIEQANRVQEKLEKIVKLAVSHGGCVDHFEDYSASLTFNNVHGYPSYCLNIVPHELNLVKGVEGSKQFYFELITSKCE